MKKLILAATAVALISGYAVAQDKPKEGDGKEEPQVKITAEQIKEAIGSISELSKDKAKLKSYCEMLEYGAQADQALEKNDEKKAEELGKKAEAIADTLGDKFNSAMGIVAQVNPEEKSSEGLFKAVDDLDASCSK